MSIKKEQQKIYQKNFPKEAFLQSEQWRDFQKSFGREVFYFDEKTLGRGAAKDIAGCFSASIIGHNLPVVGKYFYVPRGPIFGSCEKNNPERIEAAKKFLQYSVWLAKENRAGWIRIDPQSEKDLNLIAEAAKNIQKENGKISIRKAPHDMQPRQIFEIDITKSEEELLAQMKSKTRYNIRLAEKKGIEISNFKFQISNKIQNPKLQNSNFVYIDEFLKLVRITSKRQGIVPHPDEYYQKMLQIPGVELYAAEYDGKVIAANIVVFHGDEAIYLHGASDEKYKSIMAPFLLQWKQIQDAKNKDCKFYDFGGVKMQNTKYEIPNTNWEGITRFKLGFSPNTKPVEFPGSYDIVINPFRYYLYKILQKAKSLAK